MTPQSRIHSGLLYALASSVCLTSFACDGVEPFTSEQLVGTYELVAISGNSLPFVRRETPSDPTCLRAGETGDLMERINGGSIELDGSSFSLDIRVTRFCTYGNTVIASQNELAAGGPYEIEGGTVVLDATNPGWPPMEARYVNSRLTVGLAAPNDIYRDYQFRPTDAFDPRLTAAVER